MKKILKRIAIVIGILAVIGFFAFLYFIPPLTMIAPEEFSKPVAQAGPSLDTIADAREQLLARRGEYIVKSVDCSGCHTPLGDQGPKWEEYLAGGNKTVFTNRGTFVTRNLTPDGSTGLARRSEAEVRRVLRSGMLPEGRVAHYRDMPWAAYSNLTEEDRYAAYVYLRHLKPIYHLIPADETSSAEAAPGALETYYGLEVAGHGPAQR